METTDFPAGTCDDELLPCAALALQSSGTKCRCVSSFDTALQRVIEAWAAMPAETRRAVLALVDATSKSNQ
jgi:hypothetical protein